MRGRRYGPSRRVKMWMVVMLTLPLAWIASCEAISSEEKKQLRSVISLL